MKTTDFPTPYTHTIKFVVPGRPVPKGRPRVGATRTVTPKKTKRYQRDGKCLASIAMRGRPPFDGPCAADITAVYQRPASRPDERFAAHVLADLDNVVKTALDLCTGIVYVDDRQIVALTADKIYGQHDELRIRIYGRNTDPSLGEHEARLLEALEREQQPPLHALKRELTPPR